MTRAERRARTATTGIISALGQSGGTLKIEQIVSAEGKDSNPVHGIRLCILQKVGWPVRRGGLSGVVRAPVYITKA